MKVCVVMGIFLMLLLGGCASNSDHLSKDALKDPTGMLARKKWLLEEIDMVERELSKVQDNIETTRMLIKQQARIDSGDVDGEIEKYSSDLSRWEYEKIDLIKELDSLRAKL